MTDSAIVANQPTKSHQKSSPKTAPEPSMVPVPYKYVYKDNRLCGLCRFCQSESKSESEIKKMNVVQQVVKIYVDLHML